MTVILPHRDLMPAHTIFFRVMCHFSPYKAVLYSQSICQHGAGHFVCNLSLEIFVLLEWYHSELDFGTLFPTHRTAVTPHVFHSGFKRKIVFGFAVGGSATRSSAFTIKPTRCTSFPNLLRHETLHVSGSSSAHHQEFIRCTLRTGICHTGL